MSYRFNILTTLSKGITEPKTIAKQLDIKTLSLSKSAAAMVREKWLTINRNKTTGLISSYNITELGNEILTNKNTAFESESSAKYPPDFNRMRQHLKLGSTISNAKIIIQWNDKTEYYVPYTNEIEKPLRRIEMN